MSERFSSLSGYWTGVYDYPSDREPVAFNAVLTETDGVLAGETIEPNTFATPTTSELFASLSGARDGAAVRFVKTYENARGAGHSLIYEGVADAALAKIEGSWRTTSWPVWGGPFVMNRSVEGVAEAIVRYAESDLLR